MSSCLIYVHPSGQNNPEDAELGSRIGIALTNQKRVGWHELFIAVRGGVVTLSGTVSTGRDRRLVNSVTGRVAGVRRIKDEVSVDEKYARNSADAIPLEEEGGQPTTTSRADHFRSLPVVTESLEDILAGRTENASFYR